MHAILTVFRKELRESLRDRRTLFSALIFGPLFGPLLFAAALNLMIERGTREDTRPITLAVVHGERAPNLMAHLRQYGITIEDVVLDDAEARAAVLERKHRLVLFVGEEYAAQLAASQPAPLYLYSDSSDSFNDRDVARVKAILAQYSSNVARLRLVTRGVDPRVLTALAVHDVDVATPTSRSVIVLGAMSYLVLVTMLMGGMYLAIDATAGERERGSLESLLTVPVERQHLIYGKILAACSLMLLTLVLTVTAFTIMLRFVGLERFGMSVALGPWTAIQLVLFCAPLVLLGASLMTIVAAYTRSYREAQTYLGLVLLVPTLPLIFAGAMNLQPSTAMMTVPSLSQHFLIMSLLRAEAIPPLYIALSVGVTLAAGALLALVAGRLYQRETLLG